MKESNWFEQLNFIAQCRRNSIPVWQCPSVLFILAGIVNIGAMWATYYIGAKYASLEIVIAMVIGVSLILLVIGYIISDSFRRLMNLNRMKNEFIDIVSHQLRTPLNSLSWALSLFSESGQGKMTVRQSEYLAMVRESNARMTQLLNDLLVVSRIDQEKIVFRPENLSLGKLINGVIKNFLSFASASNIKISFSQQGNLDCVVADRQYLKLILENLIDNAVRYIAHQGEVKIIVSSKQDMIQCEVQDNGVGIPIEEQKHVFQKFYRSRNAMRYQTEGSGLGLFIIKRLLDKMDGQITFHSLENVGTTFFLNLPACKIKDKQNS